MTIVVVIMFVGVGTCMETLLGLLLGVCVIVCEPAHECVATGNVIAVSALVSFWILEVIAEVPGGEWAVILGIAVAMLFAMSFAHKTENDTGDIDCYFNKKTMVKHKVFLPVEGGL